MIHGQNIVIYSYPLHKRKIFVIESFRPNKFPKLFFSLFTHFNATYKYMFETDMFVSCLPRGMYKKLYLSYD